MNLALNDTFNKLVCASSCDHIIRDAIQLSCGHFICKRCLPELDHTHIDCKNCGSATISVTEKDSDHIKEFLKLNLSSLFDELEKETVKEIEKFKSI